MSELTEQYLPSQLIRAINRDIEDDIREGFTEQNLYHFVPGTKQTITEYLVSRRYSVGKLMRYCKFFLDELKFNPKYISDETISFILYFYNENTEYREIVELLVSYGLQFEQRHVEICVEFTLTNSFRYLLNFVKVNKALILNVCELITSSSQLEMLEHIIVSYDIDYDDVDVIRYYVRHIPLDKETLFKEINILEVIYNKAQIRVNFSELLRSLLVNSLYYWNKCIYNGFAFVFNFIRSKTVVDIEVTEESLNVAIACQRSGVQILSLLLEHAPNINKNSVTLPLKIVKRYTPFLNKNNTKRIEEYLAVLLDFGFNINAVNQENQTIRDIFPELQANIIM